MRNNSIYAIVLLIHGVTWDSGFYGFADVQVFYCGVQAESVAITSTDNDIHYYMIMIPTCKALSQMIINNNYDYNYTTLLPY